MEIYEKFIGSVLLAIGLAIIGYSLYSGIKVFMKGQNPPEIFKIIEPAKSLEFQKNASKNPVDDLAKKSPKDIGQINPNELQKIFSDNINSETIKSLIPMEIFGYAPRLMNYSVFSIFLWVLMVAGGKVSGLGISLIKTNSMIKF